VSYTPLNIFEFYQKIITRSIRTLKGSVPKGFGKPAEHFLSTANF